MGSAGAEARGVWRSRRGMRALFICTNKEKRWNQHAERSARREEDGRKAPCRKGKFFGTLERVTSWSALSGCCTSPEAHLGSRCLGKCTHVLKSNAEATRDFAEQFENLSATNLQLGTE